MLTPLLITKLVCEIALSCLAGRGAMVVLTGGRPEGNLVYELFRTLTQPFVSVVARAVPRFVLTRHHPLATFAVLSLIWLAATWGKIQWCVAAGMVVCR